MDPTRHEMSAMGASIRPPELTTVSDTVKSPDVDTKVKFGLVNNGLRSSIGVGGATKGQTESRLRELLEDAIGSINSELEMRRISLNFSIDEDSDSIVVQVVESESGKIIRQIPPDEILALRKRLEELTGIIFDAKV